jgi:hypothetical protein
MIFLLWVRQTQSSLAAGPLLSPRYALGDVGGHVAELVGIEGGVVSGVINLESSGA